jgi:hypothetical protein
MSSSPPVSLERVVDGNSLRWTVSQPSGNVIAVDETFSVGANVGLTAVQLVSITAPSAGTLDFAFNANLSASTGLTVVNYYGADLSTNQLFFANNSVQMAANETRSFVLAAFQFTGSAAGASGSARLFTITFQ